MKLQNGAEDDRRVKKKKKNKAVLLFNETSDMHQPRSADLCCINFHRLSHMCLKEQRWSQGNETSPN